MQQNLSFRRKTRRYIHPSDSRNEFDLEKHKTLIDPWKNEDFSSPIFNQLPIYFRCTTQAIPAKMDTQRKCKIPLAIIMEPCKVDQIPLLDFSHNLIPRCKNCEAYLSCFCTLSADKQSWICALCQNRNNFSQKYLQHFSSFQELSSSVYDMKAPRSYIQRSQIMPSYLFLIDVSHEAVSSGFTRNFCESIKSSIQNLPDSISITIIAYSKHVYIYDLHYPRETVLIEPISFKVTPNFISILGNCRRQVNIVLNKIIRIKESETEKENCYGSALYVAASALRVYGGLVIASCCQRPSYGPYSVPDRFSTKQEDEVLLFHMPSKTEEDQEITTKYQKLALKMNRLGISLHLFAYSKKHSEITVTAMPCGLTGGKCHFYNIIDSRQLHVDISDCLSDKYFWHSSMKLRCSSGIVADKVIGNVTNSNDLLYFPIFSSTSAIAFSLCVWKPITQALFQAALLWSNGPDERYIRIFNFSIPVTNDLTLLGESVDEACLSSYILKVAATNLLNIGGDQSKQLLLRHIKEIFNSISNLRSFPFFMYSLLTRSFLEDNRTINTDQKMATIINVRAMSVAESLLFLYPKLVNVEEKTILSLKTKNIERGIFCLQEVDDIVVWGYPKEKGEEARKMFTDEGKPTGDLLLIVKEMMEFTGRYLNIKFLSSDEGMKFASERMIEDSKVPCFNDWIRETWL